MPAQVSTPVVSALPAALDARLRRIWYPTRQAASMLGIPERTLRRRLERPHWVEGSHYRWVTRNTRRTLEVNVRSAIDLMNRRGWI